MRQKQVPFRDDKKSKGNNNCDSNKLKPWGT